MSTYLAVLNIGRGQIVKSRVGGLPTWTLIDPRLDAPRAGRWRRCRRSSASRPAVYGAYPFDAAGSIVDYAPRLGYALETQSRPIYAYVPDLTTVVHETAHQWFGDSVGLERWPRDLAQRGLRDLDRVVLRRAPRRPRRPGDLPPPLPGPGLERREFWNPPSASPGSPKHLFGPSIYVRGGDGPAGAAAEDRDEADAAPAAPLGDEHRHGSANIGEFTALAEQVSGRDLDPLFQRWLYQRGKP